MPCSPKEIVRMWQDLAKYKLTAKWKAEFLEHPAIPALSQFDRDTLHLAAKLAQKNNQNSELRLHEWLPKASEVASERSQRYKALPPRPDQDPTDFQLRANRRQWPRPG